MFPISSVRLDGQHGPLTTSELSHWHTPVIILGPSPCPEGRTPTSRFAHDQPPDRLWGSWKPT